MSRYSAQLGGETPQLESEQLVLLVQESPALLPCYASLIAKHDFFLMQNHTTCSLQISAWLFTPYLSAKPSALGLSVTLNPVTINNRNTLLVFCFGDRFSSLRILGHFSKVEENGAMTLFLSHFQAEWQNTSSHNSSEKPIDSCLSQVLASFWEPVRGQPK